MFKHIKNWLAWKVAKDELTKLTILHRNINDLKVWCSHNKDVSAAVTTTLISVEAPKVVLKIFVLT